MTGRLPVSLVIISRHRPQMLRRCLTAVAQLDHPNFEVVVVADPVSLAVTGAFPVKPVAFDEPNIARARNRGIAAAAGQVVAFIDDDAVPEPRWLSLLTAPFADTAIAAAGGFVVGTNGLSLQWRSGRVDRLLRASPHDVADTGVSILTGEPGLAVEIKGVNCAYRRSVLAALGGFDGELAYYLDETELNLRLAATGARVAIVADARVHHAKAASAIRRADRTPLSLFDIGASSAITLRRHGASDAETDAARSRMEQHERAKLIEHLGAARIGPRDLRRLMAGLDDGFRQGMSRPLGDLPRLGPPPDDFLRFSAIPRPTRILAGRWFQSARLRAEAADWVARGHAVRLFLFSPTALYHRVQFEAAGYWLQAGGLFGKSLRTDPPFRLWRFRDRLAREAALNTAGFGNT